MSRSGDGVSDDGGGLDPVRLTREMVAIPSVNPDLEAGGSGEEAMARYAASLLEDRGFRIEVVEVAPGRPNVIALLGVTGKALLLNGHLDTVGTAGMSVDPHGGDSTEERVVGRGAADMKAGLAIILAAADGWAREKGREGQLVVALTCDEEHASVGMQSLVQSGVSADAAVVTEPTSLAVMPSHKGFAWVEVAFAGRAAHGSRPDAGVDAIRHAAALLQEMDGLEAVLRSRPPHPLLGQASFHAGTIRGGSAWSVYPDGCTLTLERRTLPGEAPDGFLSEVEDCLRRVRDRIPDVHATTRLDLVRPASQVHEDHPLVQGLLESCTGRGAPPRVEGMTAWVDGAYLNEAGIPAVCFGPGSIAQAHSADEWINAKEIRLGAEILEDFVRSFLAG